MTLQIPHSASRAVKRLRRKGQRPGPLELYFGDLSDEELRDAERVFFSALQLSNGTFKTTAERRLDEVNELVAGLLACDRTLDVLDVAASSGVATLEWSEHLRAEGIAHRMTAADLAPEGVMLALARTAAVLWETTGYPLAVQIGSRCVYLTRDRRSAVLLRWPLRVLFALVRGHRAPARTPATAVRRVCLTRVPLASRRFLEAEGTRLIRDDIRQPGAFGGQFDVCRAANILHGGYFAEEEIRLIARNLRARLRPDGLLVICRSLEKREGRVNRVSVLRSTESGFEVAARLNGGCDVEPLLLRGGA